MYEYYINFKNKNYFKIISTINYNRSQRENAQAKVCDKSINPIHQCRNNKDQYRKALRKYF